MRKASGVPLVALAMLLTGCVTSRQARTITPSDSFLGPAARLLKKADRSEGVLLLYRKDATKWDAYDKILLSPTLIVSDRPSTLPAEDLADYQKLVDVFHDTLRAKLGTHYQLVESPVTGTLRLQAAIVNGAAANNTLKVAKTIAPYAGIADFVWTMATGKPAFAGEVSLEYIIRDAQTGDVLEAVADRRVGGNEIGKSTFTTWGDVQNILTYWTDLTVYRLCVDRKEADCQKPSAGLTDR